MKRGARLLMPFLVWFVAGSGGAAEVAAGIVFSAGAASIVTPDGQRRPASRGGELLAGESIETGDDGRAQLRFRDGASMSLQPATRFRVDDFRFVGGKGSPEDKGFFTLLKGGFRTITGLIGKGRREQYQVGTTVATIGIRGTEYSANLGSGGLVVTTVSGLVEVCNAAGCVLVSPGETTTVVDKDAKPGPGSPPKVGQGDLLPQLPSGPGADDRSRVPVRPLEPPPINRNTTNW